MLSKTILKSYLDGFYERMVKLAAEHRKNQHSLLVAGEFAKSKNAEYMANDCALQATDAMQHLAALRGESK